MSLVGGVDLNLTRLRNLHEARTTVQYTSPNGDCSERTGRSQSRTTGSASWVLLKIAGPIHWRAMWKAGGRNLHVVCAWMLVSSWPQTGQVVAWGSQFSSLCPTGSFIHSAVRMNVMSPTGNFNCASAVHVCSV